MNIVYAVLIDDRLQTISSSYKLALDFIRSYFMCDDIDIYNLEHVEYDYKSFKPTYIDKSDTGLIGVYDLGYIDCSEVAVTVYDVS